MSEHPLCVDLDHSLINTDLSVEALILALKRDPLTLFKAPLWLMRGRPYLKKKLADKVALKFDDLPLNHEVVEFVEEQAETRKVYLVTGSPEKFANQISRLFPFFTESFGTSGEINLIARNKANFLVERFGDKNFDYLGDSLADLKVFPHANKAYVVNNKASYLSKVSNMDRKFTRQTLSLKIFLKAIRIHQWSKNLLLLAPLLLAHAYGDFQKLQLVFQGMLAFSLSASAIYLINDLFDLENDRQHPIKKNRPIANGSMSIPVAILTALSFLTLGLLIGFLVNIPFGSMLVLYMITNLLYSFKLKKIAILDVFCLAGFYTLRVGIGGLAASVPVSFWLKVFSFFLFLSLAFLKRYAELHHLFHKMGRTRASGRGYEVQDLSQIYNLGSSAGMVSVLVFCLYIYQISTGTYLAYKTEYLWPIAIILLYWVSSIWLRGGRGQVQEDPVKFALKDPQSLILGVICALCALAARWM